MTFKIRFQTRRQQGYASFKNKDGQIQDSDKLFSLQLTQPQVQKFYADFHNDANGSTTSTDWGKERRSAAERDLLYRHDRVELTKKLIQFGGSSWPDRVNSAIDAERGRHEDDDIMPGVIRTRFGYQCSKLIPGGELLRRYFVTQRNAIAWMEAVNAHYNRRAY